MAGELHGKSGKDLGCRATRLRGWGTTDITLFFTTSRIVVAKILAGGYFVLGGVLPSKTYTHYKSAEMEKLTPEAILGRDKKNYFISYSDILKINIKKPGTLRDGKIKVSLTTGDRKFGISKTGLAKVNKYEFGFLERLLVIFGDRIAIEQ